MSEDYEVYWELDCGEHGTYEATEVQVEAILRAEQSKTRFVRVDDAIINVAFIRVMRKRRREKFVGKAPQKKLEPTEQGKKMLENMRGLIESKRVNG